MDKKMTELLDVELNELVGLVTEIDYEGDDFRTMQRAGALAFSDLLANFSKDGTCKDKSLIALVLVRLDDLQVRDYAMGITDSENIENLFNMWRWLLQIAPVGYLAPIASLYSAVSYEKGDNALALAALEQALADDPEYPLALLLRRVYLAGWPAESFATMRKELHPKVCAALFSE
jgi:hypothetical protein